jgi:hypothetical protein
MALVLVTGAGCETGERGDGVITVEGESAAETNIPTAPDRRASGGRYLALATAEAPPAGGWLATYEVDAPAGGVYRLQAVATPPVEQPHVSEYGSFFRLG